ncbi:hypothetical protein M5K25_005535 [Dendrobium thyrsiflorum]|uniref:Uncharacterized protein n=1 Tax=Dendrobium thyrsiflorum TaxID=117978 RepID=A0ABD0VI65_DENTH
MEHIICLIDSISHLPYPFVESRVLITNLCLVSGKDDSLDLRGCLVSDLQRDLSRIYAKSSQTRDPVVASDKNAVTSDPAGREQSSKERSRTATKEPKKRRVQSLHLLRSNEAEQQLRKEK